MSRGWKITIAVLVGILIIILVLFSDMISVLNTLDDLSGVMLVLITAVYAYSTHKIFRVSNAQMKQMQKQHQQNIGFQMLKPRTEALTLLEKHQYEQINLSAIELLFNTKLHDDIYTLWSKDTMLQIKIKQARFFVMPLEKADGALFIIYNSYLDSIHGVFLTPEQRVIFNNFIDDIVRIPEMEKRAESIRSNANELISDSLEIDELNTIAVNEMKEYIASTLS